MEHESTPDHALELTAGNICEDTREFIRKSFEDRSKDSLCQRVLMQLKLEIRETLVRRVQVTFLHGKLLSNQLYNRYHHDNNE